MGSHFLVGREHTHVALRAFFRKRLSLFLVVRPLKKNWLGAWAILIRGAEASLAV